MGTNYYLHEDACHTCGRGGESLHICKSLTMFEGHFTWDDDGDWHPWLVSWSDWKLHLRASGGAIRTEYGDTLTVESFVAAVEATPAADRRRQHDAIAADWSHRITAGPAPGGDWLDADGFSFTGEDFT